MGDPRGFHVLWKSLHRTRLHMVAHLQNSSSPSLSKGLSYSFLLFTLARGIGSVYGTYLTIENTNAFAAGLLALFVLNILAASLSYDKLLPLKDKENKRA